MNKKIIYAILSFLSFLLVGWFCVKSILDIINYNEYLNSAPLSVFILLNICLYLVPAIILSGISWLLKQKFNKRQLEREYNEKL